MLEDPNAGDVTQGGQGATGSTPTPAQTTVEVDPARRALVKEWTDKVKEAEKHWEDKAFKRMRICMKLAVDGTTIEADAKGDGESTSYVVPIINRIVNHAVGTLYAKNPTAVARRKQKLFYTLWDGDPDTLKAALMASQPQPVVSPEGIPLVDHTGAPALMPGDPNAMALLQEVQDAKQQMLLYDRMGKTMKLLFAYFMQEQSSGYKQMFKALVRRVKTNGVGYVELDFQRLLKQNPDIAARINDITSKIDAIEAGTAQAKGGEMDDDSADVEKLRLNMQDLQRQLEVVVREGPLLSFPRSTEVFPDKDCRQLSTWQGSSFIVRRYDMTSDRIKKVYKKDIGTEYTAYHDNKPKAAGDKEKGTCRVYRVQDKENQQVFVLCDGHPDFLVEPATPEVDVERFFTIFAFVFNDVESEDNPFPPSDVWNARHMQREYNSSAQGRREHKIAARPRPIAKNGKLEQKDKDMLASQRPFELIEVNSIDPNEPAENIVGWLKTPGYDPNLYETQTTFQDIQRVAGVQEANLGGTSGDTATESSIAENSRQSGVGSDIDDLDTALSELARSMGQLMLMRLSKDTVVEICGPGAAWPDMPPTREQIVKDLILEIEAGSSGRPNKAAELANIERAMPWIQMLPGMNPRPWAKMYLDLFDFDLEDNYVEGTPSIAALNKMAGSSPAGAGPNAPDQQGDKGGDNAKNPQDNEPQSQPAHPAPMAQPGPGMPTG